MVASTKAPDMEILRVTEGVSGLWHYHLSKGNTFEGLCGAQVMNTSMVLADWGKPFGAHFPKRPTFCARCSELAKMSPRGDQ